MKSMWLREVKAILEEDRYLLWWKTLADRKQQRETIRERLEELETQIALAEYRVEHTHRKATDALYRAGEHEDAAAAWVAEIAALENRSYEAVAEFESQRIYVSDLYSRMGAKEHMALNLAAEEKELRASMDAENDVQRREDLGKLWKRRENEVQRAKVEIRELATQYQREERQKQLLWEQVETLWARSLDINLGVSERRMQGRHSRRRAERLFEEAERFKRDLAQLRQSVSESKQRIADLDQAILSHRLEARDKFSCLVGEDFLYWPRRENVKQVLCVPLEDFSEGYNIEIESRHLYVIHQKRGVEFIEPLPPCGGGGSVDEDARIDDFFQKDRPVCE